MAGFYVKRMTRDLRKFLGTVFAILIVAVLYEFNIFPAQESGGSLTAATSTVSDPVTTSTVDATSTGPLVNVTSTNALVTRVVDGDTLVAIYDGKVEEVKVRLLGVDTPESVDPRRGVQCFGKEASKYLQQLVEGKRVRLEEDPAADERDKYGRLLRNVITETGGDVNALLIQEGYANAYVSFPQNKERKAALKRFEAKAKAEQKGLWHPETCNGLQ